MEIEITKKQETINDVLQEPFYTVRIKRIYGTGDLQWSKDSWLHDFDEQDMKELAKRLAEKFLT